MKRLLVKRILLFLTVTAAVLLIVSTIWIQDKFGDTTIDSIIFHYKHSLIGTPPKFYISYFKRICVSIGIGIISVAVVHSLTKRVKKKTVEGITFGFTFLLMLFSVSFASAHLGILPYIQGNLQHDPFIEDNYIAFDKHISFPEKKRNVIVLVLESMESTFFDDELFSPPLIPYLESLTSNNHSCLLYEGKNLNWTTAGLTGLMFGVPLFVPANNYYNPADSSFLPGADSILSVFEKNGYSINLIMGCDAQFGSIDNIFTSHAPSTVIYDKVFLTENGVPPSGKWGIKDADLYLAAQDILLNISENVAPFFVMLETIDTHSKAIVYGDYPRQYNDDRDAFLAADHMVHRFLTWLEKQDFFADTTVLIVGDHLYMNNFLGHVQLKQPRTIYNVFLNTVISDKANSVAHREATMLDMGPSLLEAAGVKLSRGGLALGRSVFDASSKTLVEKHGLSQLKNALSGRSDFYNQFFISKKATPTSHKQTEVQ